MRAEVQLPSLTSTMVCHGGVRAVLQIGTVEVGIGLLGPVGHRLGGPHHQVEGTVFREGRLFLERELHQPQRLLGELVGQVEPGQRDQRLAPPAFRCV